MPEVKVEADSPAVRPQKTTRSFCNTTYRDSGGGGGRRLIRQNGLASSTAERPGKRMLGDAVQAGLASASAAPQTVPAVSEEGASKPLRNLLSAWKRMENTRELSICGSTALFYFGRAATHLAGPATKLPPGSHPKDSLSALRNRHGRPL